MRIIFLILILILILIFIVIVISAFGFRRERAPGTVLELAAGDGRATQKLN
jgi:hypothetical protein